MKRIKTEGSVDYHQRFTGDSVLCPLPPTLFLGGGGISNKHNIHDFDKTVNPAREVSLNFIPRFTPLKVSPHLFLERDGPGLDCLQHKERHLLAGGVGQPQHVRRQLTEQLPRDHQTDVLVHHVTNEQTHPLQHVRLRAGEYRVQQRRVPGAGGERRDHEQH